MKILTLTIGLWSYTHIAGNDPGEVSKAAMSMAPAKIEISDCPDRTQRAYTNPPAFCAYVIKALSPPAR